MNIMRLKVHHSMLMMTVFLRNFLVLATTTLHNVIHKLTSLISFFVKIKLLKKKQKTGQERFHFKQKNLLRLLKISK